MANLILGLFISTLIMLSAIVVVLGQDGRMDVGAVRADITPKVPVAICSGESQKVTCQVKDSERRLYKQMRELTKTSGYFGYVDFLLAKRVVISTGDNGTKTRDLIVARHQIDNVTFVTDKIEMMLKNITIHDAGDYHCKAIWHSYIADKSWESEQFSLRIFDCLTLEVQKIKAVVRSTVTIQCVDANNVAVQWFKEGELLDDLLAREGQDLGIIDNRAGIRNIELLDEDWAGIYQCRATFADTQQIFIRETEVTLRTRPQPSYKIVVVRKSSTSMVLNWEQMPPKNPFVVADPHFFQIIYHPIDETDARRFKRKHINDVPEVMLTDLKPSTVYMISIIADNDVGRNNGSSRVVVTPGPDEIVQVDRSVLTMMSQHIKVLEQDLDDIAEVLVTITGQKEPKNTIESNQDFH